MQFAIPTTENETELELVAAPQPTATGELEKSWRPYLMVAPAVITIVVVFGGGLFVGVIQSMGYLPMLGMTEFTLRHYVATLADPRFYVGLGLTFAIAAASTLLAAAMAMAAALVLRKAFAAAGS